jgi:hypothetical protein
MARLKIIGIVFILSFFWFSTNLSVVHSKSIELDDKPASLNQKLYKRENKNSKRSDDDYFYDDSLTKEDIEKIQKKKQEEEQIRKEKEQSEKKAEEDQPNWFKEINEQNSKDPFEEMMKTKIEEYIKKYQKEQMDKFREKYKSKSDLNHQLLSIITLSVFFGSGIVIGLIIVFFRSYNFNAIKSKGRNGEDPKKNIKYAVVEQQ